MIDFKLRCTIKRLAVGTPYFSKQITVQLLKMGKKSPHCFETITQLVVTPLMD